MINKPTKDDRHELKTICMDCDTTTRFALAMRNMGFDITHGICDEHMQIRINEMADETRKMLSELIPVGNGYWQKYLQEKMPDEIEKIIDKSENKSNNQLMQEIIIIRERLTRECIDLQST